MKKQRADDDRGQSGSNNNNRCFLCGASQCPLERCEHCEQIWYCSQEHFHLHRDEASNYCYPYCMDYKEGIGRILRATRPIKAMEHVLRDPGAVIGPNYTSKPVCLECLRPVSESQKVPCPQCSFPLCSEACINGPRHHGECAILSRVPLSQWPEGLRAPQKSNSSSKDADENDSLESNLYAIITPLRLLLESSKNGDLWRRTNQLMDHLEERKQCTDEWIWYQENIVNFLRNDLGLASRFSEADVHRAIGLLNVNAVALHFPKWKIKQTGTGQALGKGVYPIFAIMSHYCVCNARYTLHPDTFAMHVYARRAIASGEEICVQYLSALYATAQRRQKIRTEWYFDCVCARCADPTECGTFISAIKCYECSEGNVLPVKPLDPVGRWRCLRCKSFELPASKVESLVEAIEHELEAIGKSGHFQCYESFISKYSHSILHSNHYLIMTATRLGQM